MRFRPLLVALALPSCGPAPAPSSILVAVGPPVPAPASSHAGASKRPAVSAIPSSAESEGAACEAGDKNACASLVFRCRPGGASNDVPFASSACAERDRKACNAGVVSSCRSLANRYQDESATLGVHHDKAQAVALFERGCLADDWESCFLLALAYEYGRGVQQDDARAVSALVRSCGNAEACILPQASVLLADHLASGRGTGKDEARAARLYLLACGEGLCEYDKLLRLCADAGGASGTRVGCVPLALLAGVRVPGVPKQNGRRALSLLDRACKRGEAMGCATLADWYGEGVTLNDELSVQKNERRAAAFRANACAAGDKSACAQP